jgi:diguanylate cyclase (GGDEF)-like protein
METDVTHDQREKTAETSAIGKRAFQISILLCALGLVVSIVTALLITRNISGAINQLMVATQRIAKGDFDFQPDIRNADELGALSTAFVQMAQRLKQLEEMNLDASPLTRLPGGVSIEKNLQLRIESRRKIAFCLLDINHFKAFNDSYGYIKGNELIRATAEIIKDVVSASGTADDFIGHIGGDDFVVMTDPENFKTICTEIIERFDRTAPGFYDEETRQRQYLISHNRQGQQVTFPLASLSIAVVTNVNRQLASHIEYGEVAAELKEYAKSKSGSNWVVDRRRHSGQPNHPLHQT